MNLDTIRNALSTLVSDLRTRRLLPVLALLVVAIVAIPIVLSQSGSPAGVPTAGALPPVKVPSVPTGTDPKAEPGNNFLTGPAHDPFVQPQTSTTAASPTSAAASATAGAATKSSPAAGTATTARPTTVTVTVAAKPSTTTTPSAPTTTPKPVYSAYEVSVAFGAAGAHLRTFHNLKRFALLPDRNAVVGFLGVEKDGKTAVFVVAPNATPAGEGKCSPSVTKCTYLAVRPGAEVLLLVQASNGTSSEYQMRYVSVRKLTSKKSIDPGTSPAGKKLIDYAAKYTPVLGSMRFAPYTGALTIHLGRTQSVRTATAGWTPASAG